jgi:hypothetical protein
VKQAVQKIRQGMASKVRSNGRRANVTRGTDDAEKDMVLASDAPQDASLPRSRIRLRSAMRRAGLDEWKVAWLLNYKIDRLAESTKSSDNKLLLDYLKEAARHLDPASARATTGQDTSTIEMVHNVPRPNRNESERG